MWIHQEFQRMYHLWPALPVEAAKGLMTTLTGSSRTNARVIMMTIEAQKDQITVMHIHVWNTSRKKELWSICCPIYSKLMNIFFKMLHFSYGPLGHLSHSYDILLYVPVNPASQTFEHFSAKKFHFQFSPNISV